MRILLQPSSGKEAMEHFEETISKGVPIDSINSKISVAEFDKLKEIGESYIKVWGIVPTVDTTPRKQWTDLKENDWVLFYAKKGFYYIAKVHSKVHNAELAKSLWGVDEQGRTWENIYFIKEGKQIQTPYNPEILGYAKNHVIQGAILLDEKKSDALKKYLEQREGEILDEEKIEPTESEEASFIKKIKVPKSSKEAEEEIKSISEEIKNKPVEIKIKTAKILARNPRFARLTKERAKYRCEICGAEPFIQKSGMPYAEAHHKYELAKSRIDNPEDMICVCPTCHEVIHHGNEIAMEDRKKLKK